MTIEKAVDYIKRHRKTPDLSSFMATTDTLATVVVKAEEKGIYTQIWGYDGGYSQGFTPYVNAVEFLKQIGVNESTIGI